MIVWADVDDYCMWLAAGGRARGTLVQRRFYLRRLAAAHPDLSTVTLDDLTRFIGAASWGPAGRKSARSAVRGFYGWGVLTERIDQSPAGRLPPVHVPAGRPRPAPSAVLADALGGCTDRVRLMLMLGAYAGLRCGEISRVHSADIVDASIRVRGKGGRVRDVPLHPILLAELVKVPSGWAFPGQIDGHLSPHYVSKVLSHALAAGWTAHTLRHSFASACYAHQRDILAVQTLLGHASVTTTQIYTAVPDGAMRAAVYAVAPVAA